MLLSILALCGCASCDRPATMGLGECVVLLHGLNRSSLSMEIMEYELTQRGFLVANIDYPSTDYPIEELAPMAVEAGLEQCTINGSAPTVHFVTHSMGGIIVRQYFANNKLDSLGRVVMLAPPNQGSNAVDVLRNVPGFEWLNGPAGFQLGKGEESIPLSLPPPDFEFAVIAGNRTIDPVTSQVLDNPDDGKVSVEDTKLDGMRDFRVVGASHTFIMQKADVIQLVDNFLRYGSFDRPF
jgi:hypothetical protein